MPDPTQEPIEEEEFYDDPSQESIEEEECYPEDGPYDDRVGAIIEQQPNGPIEPWPEVSGVYIVRVSPEQCKIGCTGNIRKRLRGLQGQYAYVVLLAYFPVKGDGRKARAGARRSPLKILEGRLHDKHAVDWLDVPGTRELFRLSPAVQGTIDRARQRFSDLGPWDPTSVGTPTRSRVRLPSIPTTPQIKCVLSTLPRLHAMYAEYLLRAHVTGCEHLIRNRQDLERWLSDSTRKGPLWDARMTERLYHWKVYRDQLTREEVNSVKKELGIVSAHKGVNTYGNPGGPI